MARQSTLHVVVLNGYAMVEESHRVGNRLEYRPIPTGALKVPYPEGTDLLMVSVTVQPDKNRPCERR